MWQKRGPALLCLLLATALTVFAAARSPAAPPGEVPPPQTLEEESLLYEETPVQIISLLDLEPVDTRRLPIPSGWGRHPGPCGPGGDGIRSGGMYIKRQHHRQALRYSGRA